MKFCQKLYLCTTIQEKIVSHDFMIFCHVSYLFILFLDNLTLGVKTLRVKSSHLAKVPC
jgi:hypothetical protein